MKLHKPFNLLPGRGRGSSRSPWLALCPKIGDCSIEAGLHLAGHLLDVLHSSVLRPTLLLAIRGYVDKVLGECDDCVAQKCEADLRGSGGDGVSARGNTRHAINLGRDGCRGEQYPGGADLWRADLGHGDGRSAGPRDADRRDACVGNARLAAAAPKHTGLAAAASAAARLRGADLGGADARDGVGGDTGACEVRRWAIRGINKIQTDDQCYHLKMILVFLQINEQ
jgi:hypothetical protein